MALQALYDSEINFEISTFWDGGFNWRLGDDMNGWKAQGNEDSFEAVLLALKAAALQHFPDSDLAVSGETA